MSKDKYIIIFTTLCCLLLPFIRANAKELEKPEINHAFDAKREARINKVAGLPSRQAFERLKGIDFFINEKMMHKAISKTFKHRREEGIDLALGYLSLPEREIKNGTLVDRSESFHVAKKILEVFPDESIDKLCKLYKNGNTTTKANIIRASGKIAGEQPIKDLLIHALEDKTPVEEEDIEMDGWPLRICDVAYNQLVLRYSIRNVLRTIGYSHRIEVRDYHIAILNNML